MFCFIILHLEINRAVNIQKHEYKEDKQGKKEY